MLTICEAMEAFVAGWVSIRRMERTITVEDFHGMTHLIFSGVPELRQRFDEFLIRDRDAKEVVGLVRGTSADVPHLLSVFTTTPEETVIAYGCQDYQLHSREYLMAIDLTAAEICTPDFVTVGRLTLEEERIWFNRVHGREVIPAHALDDPRLSYYYVRFGDDLACEGRFVITDAQVALVDSVYTAEAYRRRGLGKGLMAAILTDAAARGATDSALVASEAGRKLYLTLGYSVLADMLIFQAD